MASFFHVESGLQILGASNLRIRTNSKRFRRILVEAAQSRKMSETQGKAGKAADAAALSALPGLDAPSGLVESDMCMPPPGLAPALGLVCCKAGDVCEISYSRTLSLESCSTSTSCTRGSSSDDEETSETSSEDKDSQVDAYLLCFAASSALQTQPAGEFTMDADVCCSAPRVFTNILHAGAMQPVLILLLAICLLLQLLF